MKVETYKCDVCGKEKGTVNHWWLFGMTRYRTDGNRSEIPELSILPWNDEAAEEGFKHACGAECVQKKVSEFLGQQGEGAKQ